MGESSEDILFCLTQGFTAAQFDYHGISCIHKLSLPPSCFHVPFQRDFRDSGSQSDCMEGRSGASTTWKGNYS
ncbi:hypothetical protein VTL71DRAFT_14228 [Oculimacula yallundae]|uniref:Uncharacterized protein n=1 Tax=Oculimacula yallundae TaxID=86028 RepID=A0ABR4CHV5_9HELO